MPVLHMIFWSVVVITILTLWRLHSWRDVAVAATISSIVLFFSQVLFVELASASGIDPNLLLSDNAAFLQAGPFGWIAVLIMPLGWLAPLIGAGLVIKWHAPEQFHLS
ncbi:MAG: hypothetical protein Kow0080_17390 [Candidatus Promineifilaceae bacterium]